MKHNGSLMKAALLIASATLLSACGGAKTENSSAPGVCTVTFDLNGAPGNNKKQSVFSGDKVASYKVSKDSQGYYFVSWCTDQAGEHPYDFDQTVTSDITLYASWNFHVYFMDEVGDASAIDAEYVTVRKDHKLDAAPACTKLSAGKRFSYWYRYADNDTEHLNPIQFNVDEAITEPELVYYAKTESYGRTFNFYIDDDKIKTSVADSDQEWVELPTYAETFGEHEAFKGWYTDKTEGERFDFVDFSVVKEDYQVSETNLYARYDTIEGDKPVSDMVDAYKYKSYGAKVTEGIGASAGTYSLSLDEGCEGNESVKYGFALYPTIFYGNLYSKRYTLNLKLSSFTSGLLIQPRIFVLDADGNRVQNGELYTKNGVMESAGSKTYELDDLMAGGGSTYDWNEDHYFQLAFEIDQKTSVEGMGSAQIDSMSIDIAESSDINLDADYELNLSSIAEANTKERCEGSYDSTSKVARITNTVGKDDTGAGAFHYTFMKLNTNFIAKSGKTYKISGNISNFSDKVMEYSDRAVQFHLCTSSGNTFINKTHDKGEFEIDFTDKITSDTTFQLAISFVCTETWKDLSWGYFQNEYVEISSLKFLVS